MSTLIDHVISNAPNRITYTNVLPCPSVMISNHDTPYVCINVRIKRFQPRYKMIRNEREFDEIKFLQDFSELLFNAIYSTDDIDDKLDLFISLLPTFIGRHGLLETRTMVENWRHPPDSSADRGTCFVIKLTKLNRKTNGKSYLLRTNIKVCEEFSLPKGTFIEITKRT